MLKIMFVKSSFCELSQEQLREVKRKSGKKLWQSRWIDDHDRSITKRRDRQRSRVSPVEDGEISSAIALVSITTHSPEEYRTYITSANSNTFYAPATGYHRLAPRLLHITTLNPYFPYFKEFDSIRRALQFGRKTIQALLHNDTLESQNACTNSARTSS